MNDEKFSTDDGESIKQISVESKQPTLPSTPAEMGKPEVMKKKRGRPVKKNSVTHATVKVTSSLKAERTFHCATCRENIPESKVMKLGAGADRFAVFCPDCQKSLGFAQPDVDARILHLHNNPGKF